MAAQSSNSWRIVLWVAVVAATLAFLYATRSVLMPFVLAFIIALLLDPVIDRLQRHGVRRSVALMSVFFLFFGLVTVAFIWAAPKVTRQVSGLSSSVESVTRQLAAENEAQSVFQRWNPAVRARENNTAQFDKLLVQYRPQLESLGLPANRRALIKEYIEPHRAHLGSTIRGFFNGFLGVLGSAVSQFLLLLFTPVFAFLILLDMETLPKRMQSWVPPSIRKQTVDLISDIGRVCLGYIRGVFTSILIFTVISAVVLSLLGVPYGLLLALFFGSIYVIPYLGGLLMFGTVFLVPALSGTTGNLLFSVSSSFTFGAICLIVFLVVFFVYDNFINPRLIGGSVGLSPLVSMFVVFSGGALFGIVGMVIGYPIAGSIKVILSRILKITSSHSKEVVLPSVPLRHRDSS